MKITLVTTTIHVPTLLAEYVLDAKKYNHLLNVIVIADKKTPEQAQVFCEVLAKETGVDIQYYNVEAQQKLLILYPALSDCIPWNSIQRRNIGMLLAYLNGAEMIVTIDDDNFIAQKNYFEDHLIVGQTIKLEAYSSINQWFNICKFLKDSEGRHFFPRGYSLNARVKNAKTNTALEKGRVLVNAGLWLGDPDIDALTRIALPINVISYEKSNNFALARDTYAPFNSQNTALLRDCIPAYFLSPHIGRFDDIFASYIVKRLADHFNDYIVFGLPLVRQDRNQHDLWDDVNKERLGLTLTDKLVDWLRAIPLSQHHYHDALIELLNKLESKVESVTLKVEEHAFLKQFIAGYKVWWQTFDEILSSDNQLEAS